MEMDLLDGMDMDDIDRRGMVPLDEEDDLLYGNARSQHSALFGGSLTDENTLKPASLSENSSISGGDHLEPTKKTLGRNGKPRKTSAPKKRTSLSQGKDDMEEDANDEEVKKPRVTEIKAVASASNDDIFLSDVKVGCAVRADDAFKNKFSKLGGDNNFYANDEKGRVGLVFCVGGSHNKASACELTFLSAAGRLHVHHCLKNKKKKCEAEAIVIEKIDDVFVVKEKIVRLELVVFAVDLFF